MRGPASYVASPALISPNDRVKTAIFDRSRNCFVLRYVSEITSCTIKRRLAERFYSLIGYSHSVISRDDLFIQRTPYMVKMSCEYAQETHVFPPVAQFAFHHLSRTASRQTP